MLKNKVLFRYEETVIRQALARGRSCLMLGPRQTGKTTLIKKLLTSLKKRFVLEYPLQYPEIRRELEADPSLLIREVEAKRGHPLVFIDEAQKVPELFDAAQYLIDSERAQFIFSGSSARKLRRSGVNLLPGRLRRLYLDPLLWGELGWIKDVTIKQLAAKNINLASAYTFENSLVFGSLPGVVGLPPSERAAAISSYAGLYLEEEIRAEALSRKIGSFARFLELAAAESGTAPNFSKLSQKSGVSQPAIKEFYNILEDTLIVERIEPYSKNSRKRILSSARYYFFDLGVRNALARFPLAPELVNIQRGILFEHAVMLEIIRRVRALQKNYRVCYWRTYDGAEVDCVVDCGQTVIPIEIKASRRVALSEVKGLKTFLADNPKIAKHGYVVTWGDRPERLAENITAIPWFYL